MKVRKRTKLIYQTQLSFPKFAICRVLLLGVQKMQHKMHLIVHIKVKLFNMPPLCRQVIPKLKSLPYRVLQFLYERKLTYFLAIGFILLSILFPIDITEKAVKRSPITDLLTTVSSGSYTKERSLWITETPQLEDPLSKARRDKMNLRLLPSQNSYKPTFTFNNWNSKLIE